MWAKKSADNKFLPGFSAKLMSKDLKLAVNAANQTNSNIKFGKKQKKCLPKWLKGKCEKDFSAIIKEI